MGCDIHLYAEKRIKPSKWQFWKESKWVSIDKYTENPDFGKWEGEEEVHIDRNDRIYTDGRNYNLFCALAGVRRNHFTNDPPVISEPKGLPNDCCYEIKKEADRWNGDGHSHSWLTLKELKEWQGWEKYSPTTDDFIAEVLPKLRAASDNPEDVRIVFWFDN